MRCVQSEMGRKLVKHQSFVWLSAWSTDGSDVPVQLRHRNTAVIRGHRGLCIPRVRLKEPAQLSRQPINLSLCAQEMKQVILWGSLVGVAALCLALFGSALLRFLAECWIVSGSPDHADAIVVLGGGLDVRHQTAAPLYKR